MKPSIQRVFEILDISLQSEDNPTYVNHKIQGKWTHFSTQTFKDEVDLLSKGLIASGIQKGDTVAIMAPNSAFWNICDFGIQQTGAYVVPIYPTMSEKDVLFILQDAEVKTVFVADENLYQKIKHSGFEVPVYTFLSYEHLPNWNTIKSLGIANNNIDLNTYREQISTKDVYTLIYTSGTTGTPKGVMLTHHNMVCNTHYSAPIYPKGMKKALSFLPISHVFERMVVNIYFLKGLSIYYAESLDTLIEDMQSVKPDTFACVPRLLEKVYNRILEKGKELSGIKKKMFFWALGLANAFDFDNDNPLFQVQLNLARKLVFKKWQEALGGQIKAVILGGAALNPKLARIFWAANIRIYEGYGLTETTPVITVNQVGKVRFGSVGLPLPGVEVKIAQDGEILARGHNIMKGYYKREDLTREVIDEDGWFHTGDIGEFTNEGYLKITDRKKEMFKTAGGKYIAPQLLETKYKESPLIEQIMVVGENKKFPSALIVPNFDALLKWCANENITETDKNTLIQHPNVIEKYEQVIQKLGADFGRWEQVKKIILLAQEWTIDAGEITPKLSLKRKIILKKHLTAIEKLYEEL